MSRREHLGLRAFALLLLVTASLWPRSHAPRDREVARHAIRGQFTTAAARPSADDLPRPRNVRLVVEDTDESQLTD